MANALVNTVLFNGKRRLVVQSTFLIDTAAEMTDAIAVDKSAFTGPDGTEPTKFVIEKIEYALSGIQVLVEFEHTTDDPVAVLDGQGVLDFSQDSKYQGFVDPASAGTTGDIVMTTLTAAVGDKGSVTFYLRMKD